MDFSEVERAGDATSSAPANVTTRSLPHRRRRLGDDDLEGAELLLRQSLRLRGARLARRRPPRLVRDARRQAHRHERRLARRGRSVAGRDQHRRGDVRDVRARRATAGEPGRSGARRAAHRGGEVGTRLGDARPLRRADTACASRRTTSGRTTWSATRTTARARRRTIPTRTTSRRRPKRSRIACCDRREPALARRALRIAEEDWRYAIVGVEGPVHLAHARVRRHAHGARRDRRHRVARAVSRDREANVRRQGRRAGARDRRVAAENAGRAAISRSPGSSTPAPIATRSSTSSIAATTRPPIVALTQLDRDVSTITPIWMSVVRDPRAVRRVPEEIARPRPQPYGVLPAYVYRADRRRARKFPTPARCTWRRATRIARR